MQALGFGLLVNLKGHCPDGVTLTDVGEYQDGSCTYSTDSLAVPTVDEEY